MRLEYNKEEEEDRKKTKLSQATMRWPTERKEIRGKKRKRQKRAKNTRPLG